MWQYYYKNCACRAKYSLDDDCIFWHNEGTGPCPDAVHGDIKTTFLWRKVVY